MTTTVTVEAHCDDKTEVQVKTESANTGQTETLQDGDKHVVHVYDDVKVTVQETPKAWLAETRSRHDRVDRRVRKDA